MTSFLRDIASIFMPSWRFFDSIGPVPHLEVEGFEKSRPSIWQVWPNLLQTESFEQKIARLFLNPRGNERLYVLSCIERLLNEISQESSAKMDWSSSIHYQALVERLSPAFPNGFQFRILVKQPSGQTEVVFLSAEHLPLSEKSGQ